jgi:hypothetical protein
MVLIVLIRLIKRVAADNKHFHRSGVYGTPSLASLYYCFLPYTKVNERVDTRFQKQIVLLFHSRDRYILKAMVNCYVHKNSGKYRLPAGSATQCIAIDIVINH